MNGAGNKELAGSIRLRCYVSRIRRSAYGPALGNGAHIENGNGHEQINEGAAQIRMKHKKQNKRDKPTPLFRTAYIELGVVTIDNPWFSYAHRENASNPRRIEALSNVKESPLAWMHEQRYTSGPDQGKRYIDETQFIVGSIFRMLYEKTGGNTIQAMDTTKEPVDGGKMTDGLTDERFKAAKELMHVRAKLGDQGYKLVEQVCGQCLWLNQIEPTKHYQRLAGKRLKECLDTLAYLWGKASVNTHRRAS